MNELAALSTQMADLVAQAGTAVVAVDAGHRLRASGLVLEQSLVLTVDHVVKKEEGITLHTAQGAVPARAIGRDPSLDLALLQTEQPLNAALPLADDQTLRAGALSVVISRGRVSGLNASWGAISALAGSWRTWRGATVDRLVRVDVNLYPGISGAAVLDAEGRLVGMLNAMAARGAAVALPTSTLRRAAEQLRSRGHVRRGWLGVGLQPVRLPEHLVEGQQGLIVLSVEPGAPAEQAGLLVGDVLVPLGTHSTEDTSDVQAALLELGAGATVPARIVRGGALEERTITVGERPRRRE